MISYDKTQIKEQLSLDNIFTLLVEWGGEPELTSFGIMSTTICHNAPFEGSRKLYYYSNSGLFHCYTSCINPSFDIFELCIKVMSIQYHRTWDLNEAVRFIALRFGLAGEVVSSNPETALEDWSYLENYSRIQNIDASIKEITLQEYDSSILNNFNYELKLTPWLEEGILPEVLTHAKIGYFPGGDQITIPHYDKNNRFIGLRGRTVCDADAKVYGKYRPILVNGIIYKHPLGLNLYNFNHSKDNIALIKKAIIFESEKSTLQYQSYFGIENDISVACCGSNLSVQQMQMLLDLNVEEIIIGFDRQFQKIGDDEYMRLKKKLLKLYVQYKNYVKISFIWDQGMITPYKASPTDCGKDTFLTLFANRVTM